MRIALLLSIGLLGAAARAEGPATEAEKEKARAALGAKLILREAREYTIRVEGDPSPLTLEPGPLLKTSSPVLGTLHGGVFLWTRHGRPEAIAHVYKWFTPHTLLGVAFHSLSAGPLRAERGEQVVWAPARGGIDPKPIADAPEPADTPAARLRQMNALAARFSATHTYPSEVTRDLRLLTKPLYRYANPEGPTIDGALYAFVLATDPEVFLLLEARRDPGGRAAWTCSFSRDTFSRANASYRGREIWSVPLIPLGPGSKFYDPHEPYMELTFPLGQGNNPPESP